MPATSIADDKSPELLKVVERAKDPRFTFLAMAHLIDEDALTRAYHRLRADAAVGIDGITKEQYGQELERNIRNLHERLRTKRWRHKPIRRVHIPKDNGKSRPIGISSAEDKIVQEACASYSMRSTSRSSMTARTGSGVVAARTMRCGH
jgi:retron-type reverse transcriptase